jgi:hypothetical protein
VGICFAKLPAFVIGHIRTKADLFSRGLNDWQAEMIEVIVVIFVHYIFSRLGDDYISITTINPLVPYGDMKTFQLHWKP